jgi:CBS domain-containing protein
MNVIKLMKPKCSVAYLQNAQSVRQGLEKMKYHGYTAIPVIDSEGMYVGTVTEGDFLWRIMSVGAKEMKDLEKLSINEIVRMGWNPPIHITATIDDLISRITEQNFVPVIDDRGAFIGIVTRKDVIKAYANDPRMQTVVSAVEAFSGNDIK